MKIAARKFIAGTAFTSTPQNLPIYTKLKTFATALDTLKQNNSVDATTVCSAIKDAFGSLPASLIQQPLLQKSLTTLKDSIVAIKLLQEEHCRPLEALTNQLRNLEIIIQAAKIDSFPENITVLRRYQHRSVMLPNTTELRSSLATQEQQKALEKLRQKEAIKKQKEAEALLTKYQHLTTAVHELIGLDNEQFISTPQIKDPGFLIAEKHRPANVLIHDTANRQAHADLALKQARKVLTSHATASRTTEKKPETIVASLISEQGTTAPETQKFLSGRTEFLPLQSIESGFRLKPSSAKLLCSNTLKILKERNLSITELALDVIIEKLQTEINQLAKKLDALYGRPAKHSFKRIGNTLVKIKTLLPSAWNTITCGITPSATIPLQWDNRIPHSHGSVAPAGIADLMVIKQQLIGYEGADVAHIENILKGEKKEREHTLRRKTEESIFRETEITASEERELESTSRFELSRETSETIQEDAALQAGVSVTARYGPMVEVNATVEGSISRSKVTATKAASNFSQNVTERSVNKITERVLERTSRKVTNEVTDRNTHALDNTTGAEHIAGVYQWVHKVYQAQMFNYGARAMFEFMVAEPGAFLIDALQSGHAGAITLEKPTPFILQPDQITETNYHTWIQEYGATDILPAPQIFITKSLDFNANGGDENANYNQSGQIQIDEGYEAVHGTVARGCNIWDNTYSVDIGLGSRVHRFKAGVSWVWSTPLANERGSIPFFMDAYNVSQVAVAVSVKCCRTERAIMQWRLDTHAKLTNAYRARLAEYEEKLAALEMRAGVAIKGKNPLLNLEMMKDELKKNCISILTEQHFDLFNAISTGTNNMPQLDLYQNAAEGPYVRFFEQAFEWENMTWITYPYYWGRKDQWDERITYEDTDPQFNQFLKAGYCRVQVPAREGFSGAIDHFMTYGETWNGGPLPAISSSLYLPIADELAERLDRPGTEIPEGDSWLVKIPTTLVHLRVDDKLPRWKQNAEGAWVESIHEN